VSLKKLHVPIKKKSWLSLAIEDNTKKKTFFWYTLSKIAILRIHLNP
jgi:hypothetical protein